jgi:hypothetical protein
MFSGGWQPLLTALARIWSQNRDYTEAWLGFSYDFGVTIIRHQNDDTIVLASALIRGIHPLIIFKLVDIQGGTFLISALARTMASAFDDESWHGSSKLCFFWWVDLLCVSILWHGGQLQGVRRLQVSIMWLGQAMAASLKSQGLPLTLCPSMESKHCAPDMSGAQPAEQQYIY